MDANTTLPSEVSGISIQVVCPPLKGHTLEKTSLIMIWMVSAGLSAINTFGDPSEIPVAQRWTRCGPSGASKSQIDFVGIDQQLVAQAWPFVPSAAPTVSF